ncbi:type I restriction enzyme, S subunit [Clostridium sp. DSM 8431]|uniref:restriction endonuclease subunit S n=1 Tax=Clostridium sp. DSM 8431 TaxID=1761781 RepID=UPI0008E12776|nr:restriction endonuclease subunit S [Clostridium sp. DSM 8431]SFU37262.1 type I restriction enzyme, S subunit [Clostridium sp. DSM 8431]
MDYNVFQNNKILKSVNENLKWELYNLLDIFEDDTKNARKIKKEQYLEEGEYLIIDQGQSEIAGYTNDKDGIYKQEYPFLIFGDHTRSIKYIDAPIFIGADGVKLLKPKLDIKRFNVRYVYYFLQNVKLPSNGYSRHFKYLKQVVIALPILEQQNKIVKVLDKAQELIDKRKAQIEALDELVKSRFIEMFGNVNTNSKNWDLVSMYKLIDVVGGYAFKSTDFVEEGIPVLKIGNINAGYFKSTNLMFWKRDNRLNKYLIKPGDLVISLTGTVGKNDYGNVCIMGNDYNEYYLNQRNAKLEILSNNSLNKYYLTYILKVPEIKKRLTGISRGVRQANIANKDILNLEVPIPPINLQNQFADFVQQVDKLKLQIQESLKELEDNFNSLMQRAFKGELFN